MRVYLDNCCLQRPLDDQTQPRIKVETEAVLAILASTRAGDLVLLGSEALDFEIGRIPDMQRRSEAMAVLALAAEHLRVSDESQALAEALAKRGVGEELGVVDTIRFLNQFRAGSGNYTAERERLFQGLSVKDIAEQIKAQRKAGA
jgi:hypothetical protein